MLNAPPSFVIVSLVRGRRLGSAASRCTRSRSLDRRQLADLLVEQVQPQAVVPDPLALGDQIGELLARDDLFLEESGCDEIAQLRVPVLFGRLVHL